MSSLLHRLHKDRSGMTLVELLAAMTIAVVVVLAAGGIFIFTGKMSGEMGEAGIGKIKGDALAEFVEDQLTYAVQIQAGHEAEPEVEAGYNHVLTFGRDGIIYLDGKNLYGENYYEDFRFAFAVEKTGDMERVLSFGLKVLWRGETIYSCRSAVKFANIGLKPEWKIRYDFEESGDNLASEEADIYIYYRLEQE